MTFDCDRDAILYRVVQKGNACHEGDHSCFHNPVAFSEGHAVSAVGAGGRGDILDRLTRIIEQRKREMPEGSYVSSLFRAGRSRVAQKVGEEAAEVMVAFLSEGRERAISESADLLFHLMVALASAGASLDDVRAELEKRER